MWNSLPRGFRMSIDHPFTIAPPAKWPATLSRPVLFSRSSLALFALLTICLNSLAFGQKIDLNNDEAFRKYNRQRAQQLARQAALAANQMEIINPSAKANAARGAQRLPGAQTLTNRQQQTRHPLLAVIDLYSRTLDDRTINVLSQTIWDQVYSTERYAMLSRKSVLKILARQNMIPSDPYGAPVRPKQIATSLQCHYLLFGNIGRLGDTYSLALYIYSAKSARVEAAKTMIGLEIKDLLLEIPAAMRSLLQKLEPQRAISPERQFIPPAIIRPPLRQTRPPLAESAPPLQDPPVTGGTTNRTQKEFEQRIEKRLGTLEELLKQLNREIKSLKELKTTNAQAHETPPKEHAPETTTFQQNAKVVSVQDRAQAEQQVKAARLLAYENPDRLRHLERAVALAPDEGEYFRLYIHALCCQQHFELAIKKSDQALRKFHDDTFILLMAGYAKYMTEQYHAARIDLDKATRFDQSSLQAHYYLGLTLAKIEPQAAKLQLNKFILMAAHDPEQQEFVKEARAELSALKFP